MYSLWKKEVVTLTEEINTQQKRDSLFIQYQSLQVWDGFPTAKWEGRERSCEIFDNELMKVSTMQG